MKIFPRAIALASALMALSVSFGAEEEIVLTDNLDDFSQVLAHSPNMQIINKKASWLPKMDSRATRKREQEAYLMYLVLGGFTGFRIEVYAFGGVDKLSSAERLQILASEDGKNFTPVQYAIGEPVKTKSDVSWSSVTVGQDGEVPGKAQFLKIVLPAQDKNGWWPIITKVELTRETEPARESAFSKIRR